jgi:hypothetical protein
MLCLKGKIKIQQFMLCLKGKIHREIFGYIKIFKYKLQNYNKLYYFKLKKKREWSVCQ